MLQMYRKILFPKSGLGLHQQMGKLDMPVATASAITQLAVVAVPVCVCMCVCLCMHVCVFMHVTVHASVCVRTYVCVCM